MDKLDNKRKIMLFLIAAVAFICMVMGLRHSSQSSTTAATSTNAALPSTNAAIASTNAAMTSTNAAIASTNAAVPAPAESQPATDNSAVSTNTESTNAATAETNAATAETNAAVPQPPAIPAAVDNSATTPATNEAIAQTNAAVSEGPSIPAPADVAAAAAASAPALSAVQLFKGDKVFIFSSTTYHTHYVLSGLMPTGNCVRVNTFWSDNCQAGTRCIQISYDSVCSVTNQGWAGAYWLARANDWGDLKPGFNLTGAHSLVFWARGDQGGEVIDAFKVGGISGHKYSDTDTANIGPVTLTKEWKQYTIDLTGKNLSNIVGGFAWAANAKANPKAIKFYVDNIYFE